VQSAQEHDTWTCNADTASGARSVLPLLPRPNWASECLTLELSVYMSSVRLSPKRNSSDVAYKFGCCWISSLAGQPQLKDPVRDGTDASATQCDAASGSALRHLCWVDTLTGPGSHPGCISAFGEALGGPWHFNCKLFGFIPLAFFGQALAVCFVLHHLRFLDFARVGARPCPRASPPAWRSFGSSSRRPLARIAL